MVNVISGAGVTNKVSGASQIFDTPQFYRCDTTLSYVNPAQLSLTGVGTENTLNLLVNPTTTATTLASTISNIHNIHLKDFTGTSALTLTMTNLAETGAKAIKSVGVDNSAASVTFADLKAPVKHILYKDVDGKALTVTVDDAAFSGTPSIDVDINNVKGAGATLTIQPDSGSTGYRSVTLNSIGTKSNTLEDLVDGLSESMRTISVKGNQPLTLTNAVEIEVTKIDASGMNGGGFKMGTAGAGVIDLVGSNYADTLAVSATASNVIANSGDDLINISSAAGNTYNVDGGNGQDKAKLTMTAGTTTALNLDKTEILEIVASGAGRTLTTLSSVDSTLKSLIITGDQTVTITNPNVGTALTLIDARGMTAGGLVMSANPAPLPSSSMQIYGSKFAANILKGGSADDTITIEANTGVNHDIDANGGTDTLTITLNGATNSLTAADIENMNVVLKSDNTLTLTAGAMNEMNITGGAYSLTLGSALSSTVTKVDATGITGGSDALIMASTGGSSTGIRIDATAGADTLYGSAGADTIYGYAGNDTIDAAGGNDVIYGGDGADTISGGAGNDTIDAGAGNDIVTDSVANAGTSSVTGGAGADSLTLTVTGVSTSSLTVNTLETLTVTNAAAATLTITDSGNSITSLTKNGSDELTLSETLSSSVATVTVSAGSLVMEGISNINGMTITGGTGADTLYGSIGDDTISGGTGADTISGGDGNDAITDSMGAGSTSITGGAGTDTLAITVTATGTLTTTSLETMTMTMSADSTVTNSDTDNSLISFTVTGGANILVLSNHLGTATTTVDASGITGGSDYLTMGGLSLGTVGMTITGSEGNDTLHGSAGADTIAGGLGVDTIFGGAGNDAITDTAAAGSTSTVNGGANTDSLNLTLSGSGGSMTLTATALETLTVTTNGDNTITITDAGNSITSITATGGANSLIIDSVLGTAVVTLDASGITGGADNLVMNYESLGTVGITITGSSGADVLRGSDGPDTIAGGNGADEIHGDAGADTISGGAGNDTIRGGADADTLTGDAGSDDFVVTVIATADTVTDFTIADDEVQFGISELVTGGLLVLKNGNSAAIAGAMAGTVRLVAAPITATASDRVFVVTTSTFADSDDLEVDIEASGNSEITLGTASTAGDDYIIVWSDGTDGHVGYYNAATGATTFAAGGTYTELMTLSGLDGTEVGNLVTANFAFIA